MIPPLFSKIIFLIKVITIKSIKWYYIIKKLYFKIDED